MPSAVRRSHPTTRVVAAAVLTAAAAAFGLAGCTGDPEDDGTEPPVDSGTPLARLDTTHLAVARASFCDTLDEAAVARALGGEVADATSYVSGERVEVVPGIRDVAHEFSCAYAAADGTQVRAWVFAPPVTPARAQSLVRTARAADGCTEVAEAERFGSVGLATRCRLETGDRLDGTAVTYQGLFGDAWLSCSLMVPGDTVRVDQTDQAGRWCATVLAAAAAPAS